MVLKSACSWLLSQWEKGGLGLRQSYEKPSSLCSITNVWFGEFAKQTASLLPLWASCYETTVLTASRCGVPNLNTSTKKTDPGLSMWKKRTIFDIHKTLTKGDAGARCDGTNLSRQHSGDRGRAQTAAGLIYIVSSRPANATQWDKKKKVVSNARHISFNIHSELSVTFIPADRWPNCLREVKEHVQSK